MQNLYKDLEKLLLANDAFKSEEGKILKNKVTESAISNDKGFVTQLLKNPKLKQHFFDDIEKGVLVFNREKFVRFINNKEFLPNSYTSFTNKIGLHTGEEYLHTSDKVSLVWPYKDCVLEGGQDKEDQRRSEIFYNETLAPDEIDRLFSPKALTNFEKHTQKGVQACKEADFDGNLLIKGNNLLALHSLKEKYAGKVKLIYVDPPFNTEGDDFKYNDKFNHSTWLTFLKNRLVVAKELLANDGTIYIHLDWNEVHYAKVLMDEVFGRDNFLNEIVWAYKERETSKRFYNRKHDTLLFYAKDASSNYTFNADDIRETYSDVTIKKFKYTDKDGRKYRLRTKDGKSDPAEENENTYRQYLDELGGPLPRDWFVMPFVNQSAGERVFNTQKPEALLQRIIAASSNEGDVVLDFFAGSGTTGVVAHKMKRRWICCEQLEYVKTTTLKRFDKTLKGSKDGISESVDWKGGGSFVYAELMELNQAFINDIEKADTSAKLEKIYKKMQSEGFFRYEVDIKKFDVKEFSKLLLADQKQVLLECLDKNHLYVNYSEIDDATYKVSADDKKLNKSFYGE